MNIEPIVPHDTDCTSNRLCYPHDIIDVDTVSTDDMTEVVSGCNHKSCVHPYSDATSFNYI